MVPTAAKSAASSALSVISAGNGQLNPALASRYKVNRTVAGATPTRRAISLSPTPAVLKTNHLAHLAHPCPLCWHPLPRAKAKGADPNRASRRTAYPGDIILGSRAKSSWNAERDQIGNAGRDHRGFAGDSPRNPHPSFGLPKGPSITNRTAPSLARRRPRESKVALPPQHRKGCS